MINNIIEYELRNGEEINFEDICKTDIDAEILWGASPDGMYEFTDELESYNLGLIEKKYNSNPRLGSSIWLIKIHTLLESMNLENFLKYISYAKQLYIEKFGKEHGMKAYKSFLEGIIGDDFWHKKFILTNPEFVNFLESELRTIFKYYPKRGDKVGFAIDKLYLGGTTGNMDIFDNQGEINRYKYWMNLGNKGKSIKK